MIEKEESI